MSNILCHLAGSGALFSWGKGGNGRLGVGDMENKNRPTRVQLSQQSGPVCMARCGWNFTTAITTMGLLYCWGKGTKGQCGQSLPLDRAEPELVETLNTASIVNVACGFSHVVALSSCGHVWTWGEGQ